MNKNNSPGKDSLVKVCMELSHLNLVWLLIDDVLQDETFPELVNTVNDGDLSDWTGAMEGRTSADEGALGSETGERGGDAFPKAFDRELVTPTSAQVCFS